MIIIHVLMAILAAWRLTEIITQDVIFNRPRAWWVNRFAGHDYANFLTCPRCVSVWASTQAALLFFIGRQWPRADFISFLNWPFAISMLFLLYQQVSHALNTLTQMWINKEARKITIYPDRQKMDPGGFDKDFVVNTLKSIVSNQNIVSRYK